VVELLIRLGSGFVEVVEHHFSRYQFITIVHFTCYTTCKMTDTVRASIRNVIKKKSCNNLTISNNFDL
jgi:hypothetical protein